MKQHLIVIREQIDYASPTIQSLGNNYKDLIEKQIDLDDYDEMEILSMSQSHETIDDDTILLIISFLVQVTSKA